MVHGGIRYLENGEFHLVREAVQERNRLIVNAPHYIKPLPTVIPIFKWFSGLFNAPLKFLRMLNKPAERGAIVIKIGLMIYDAYTRTQGTVSKHRFLTRKDSLREFPQINPDVIFTAQYYDGSMHTPERICIEMILDSEACNPEARALNYVALQNAKGNQISLKDQITGTSFIVYPKIVINAAGPWIDFVNIRMGIQTNLIGGTKGSHLILDNPALRTAIGENEFFFENKDGRIVLIYPLKDKVMIGTSDIPIQDPEEARCTEEEKDYFLKMIPIVFPDIPIRHDQIIFQFSGVRPLPTSNENTTGQISRDHHIEEILPQDGSEFPIFNLIGGKWTSFRSFSEEAANKALKALNLPRKVSTHDLAIGGGRNYPKSTVEYEEWIESLPNRTGLPSERITDLFERYGTRATQIAEYISQEMDFPLHFLPSFSQRELQFIAKEEKIIHLDDFLLRRSMLAKLGQLSLGNIDEIAKILGETLKWSAEQRDDEIKRTYRVLREFHGVTF
jgi:glycerol-3-phosphate dehydrogenase